MKTLKLSSLAAVIACLSLFTACNKDFESTTAASSSYDYDATSNSKKGGFDDGMETTSSTNQQNDKKAIANVIGLQLQSNPSTIGSTVNLSADVTFSSDVYKAQVQIQKSVKEASGNWSEWTDVTDYKGKIELNPKTDAPVRNYKVDYSFIATEAGESRWMIHVGGGDVVNMFSDYQPLTVTDCVNELTIEPTVVAENMGNGNYQFTVTYILTSPIDMENIKFQGGATSGGQFQHLLETNSDDFSVKHNNQNSVLTYTGSLKACTPLELSFTYIRKFSCPATDAAVTGEWKLESNNVEVAKVAPLLYTCN